LPRIRHDTSRWGCSPAPGRHEHATCAETPYHQSRTPATPEVVCCGTHTRVYGREQGAWVRRARMGGVWVLMDRDFKTGRLLGFGKPPLESRPKAATRLDLEVSAGWVSPSSRDLWGGTLCCSPQPLRWNRNAEVRGDQPTELNMRRRGQWSDCPLTYITAVLDVPLTGGRGGGPQLG
jgi:hypothetical protein